MFYPFRLLKNDFGFCDVDGQTAEIILENGYLSKLFDWFTRYYIGLCYILKMSLSLFNRCRKEFSRVFAKPGQWKDYALYALTILFFFAMRKEINLWLQQLMEKFLTPIALCLTDNDFLRWSLVFVIVAFTIYACEKKSRDYYRSISGILLIIAVVLVLVSSGEYWEYVRIAGSFTFLHLMLLALVAVLVAIFYSPRSRHLV